MKKINFAIAVVSSIFLSSCAANKPVADKTEPVPEQEMAPPAAVVVAPEPAQANPQLPTWVTMPHVNEGLADTQCVANAGSMGIQKSKATALARTEIAKQINLQVKAMDKTYQNLTEISDGTTTSGSTFEAVSKQVTQQRLSGTRPVKLEYVDFPDGSQKLCVMVTMNPDLTKELYADIVEKSGRKLSQRNDKVLYQKFLAAQAEKQLDAELEKQNN